MFVVRSERCPADKDFPERVLVFTREDVLGLTVPWRDDWSEAANHREAVVGLLRRSAGGPEGRMPHHVVGCAPLPGTGSWVTLVEEGE